MLHLVSNLENIFFSKLKSHLEYQSEVDDMNMKFRPHSKALAAWVEETFSGYHRNIQSMDAN